MTDLVETFRREHVELLSMAEQLEPELDSQTLSAFRLALLDHLDREDRQFYPVLERAAVRNPRLQLILEVFAKDRNEVTIVARRFFNGLSRRAAAAEAAANVDFKGLMLELYLRVVQAEDSEAIANEALRFFQRHPEVWATPEDPIDLSTLVTLLRRRIHMEETVIFRLHQVMLDSGELGPG